MIRRQRGIGVVALAALSWVAAAYAGPTPGQVCQAGKNGQAGKYAVCPQRAENRLVLSGNTTRYATAVRRCETKLAAKWATLIRSG